MGWDLEEERTWQRDPELESPIGIRNLEQVERELTRSIQHLRKVRTVGQRMGLPPQVQLLVDIAEESLESLIGTRRKLRERLVAAQAIQPMGGP